MAASIRSALETAGGAAMANASEIYTMMAAAIRGGKSLREIEQQFRTACARRPVLFDALVGVLHERVLRDMNFRKTADGGQSNIVREDRPFHAADSSGEAGQVSSADGPPPCARDASPGQKIDVNGHVGSAGDKPGLSQSAEEAVQNVPGSPADQGLSVFADQAAAMTPPAGDDIPVSLAAHRLSTHGHDLRKLRPSAQALTARDYERRAAIRGESWLLSYAIPGGPPLMDMPAVALGKMRDRMVKEGVERGQAALLINAIMREVDKRGRISESDPRAVREFLTPAVIAELTLKYSSDAIAAGLRDLRKHFTDFAKPEITEAADGTP